MQAAACRCAWHGSEPAAPCSTARVRDTAVGLAHPVADRIIRMEHYLLGKGVSGLQVLGAGQVGTRFAAGREGYALLVLSMDDLSLKSFTLRGEWG